MMTRTSRVFMASLMLLGSLTISVADSAKEMLAAGRVDEAITELNGRLSSTAADADSSNLLCRAYFALEDWNRAESSCRKAVALDPENSRFHLWLDAYTAKRRIAQISSPRQASLARFAENLSARCN